MSKVWQEENLYFSGDDFFRELGTCIESAKETIDLEYYIFESDALGHRIADLLAAAAKRGVKVRVLADGVGSPNFARDFVPSMQEQAIQTRVYHPIPFLAYSSIFNKNKRKKFLYLLASINKRTHRKIAIIDRTYAWVGSMNICACHSNEFFADKAWRDCALKVRGEDVAQLVEAFNRIWKVRHSNYSTRYKAWYERRERDKLPMLVRLNSTIFMRRRNYQDLLRRIRTAKNKVWIETAYFVPKRSLLRALKRAAKRGADVRILVPKNSDIFFMPWLASTYYEILIPASIAVYEYLPSMLHAKTIVIDDWAIVGSTNLNHRSLLHDLEVDVELTHSENIKLLILQFEKDLSQAAQVTIENWQSGSIWKRLLGKVLYVFRNWF